MAKSKLEEALEKYLKGNLELRAGILDKQAYPSNEDGSGGEFVATVAYKQEFGEPSENIPSRPFFRHAISVNKDKWSAIIAKGFRSYDGDGVMALRSAGEEVIDDLRESVRTWSTPPNSKETVDRKGFNNPLIDTGQLMNSFSYEVNDDQG
ncbi:hypothetical protein [Providencia rustigianii]|uniref:hypothetical protein n=1 Tax=Providencia rustigianii TaxID=158850 RepID=UPI0038B412EB